MSYIPFVLYDFRCSSCDQSQVLEFPIGKAPKLGRCQRCPSCGNQTLVRVISRVTVPDAKLRFDDKYPYVCRTFRGMDGVNHHTPEGHPVIESKKHEREVMARSHKAGGHCLKRV